MEVKIKKLHPKAVEPAQTGLLTLVCKTCGQTFEVPKWRAKAKYCSKVCSDTAKHAAPNCVCPICGVEFHIKESYKKRLKNACCSMACSKELRRRNMSGEGNHQFGLRGHLNSSHKGDILIRGNHHNTDQYAYVPEHPKATKSGRVLLHRYIVEQNHSKFSTEYFEEIDGWVVLKDGISVHHKNGNHNDNSIENLQPMTRGAHTSVHNKEAAILRDSTTGRISSTSRFSTRVGVKLWEKAELPLVASLGAGGADLKSIERVTIAPRDRGLIRTGVCVEIPSGMQAFIMGRSGNTIKRGLLVALSLIDSDYRGAIGVIAFNHSDKPIEINPGDRVAQMVIIPVPRVEFVEVEELSETERGEGGYGSTGK